MKIICATNSERSHENMFSQNKFCESAIDIAENVLQKNLIDFFGSFNTILTNLPENCGKYRMKELYITLQVNGSGGIELIGKANVGATGGFVFKLIREDQVGSESES
jgi:hypothetical protein